MKLSDNEKKEIKKYIKEYNENKLTEAEFDRLFDESRLESDVVYTRVRAHINNVWKRRRTEKEEEMDKRITQLTGELQKKMT